MRADAPRADGDGRVRAVIEDDGPGIPKADPEWMFEPFVGPTSRGAATRAARVWAPCHRLDHHPRPRRYVLSAAVTAAGLAEPALRSAAASVLPLPG